MTNSKSRAELGWPTREESLTWRIEDLEGRLCELTENLPDNCMDEMFDRHFTSKLTSEQLDYTIPERLYTVEDVLSAIDRAKDKLWCFQCEQREARLAKERQAADMIPGQIVLIGFADPAGYVPERLAS